VFVVRLLLAPASQAPSSKPFGGGGSTATRGGGRGFGPRGGGFSPRGEGATATSIFCGSWSCPAKPKHSPPQPALSAKRTGLPLLLKERICPGIGAAAAGMLCPSLKLSPTQLLCPASTHTSITLPAGHVKQTLLSTRSAKTVLSQQQCRLSRRHIPSGSHGCAHLSDIKASQAKPSQTNRR
jgi:hypothetical protein